MSPNIGEDAPTEEASPRAGAFSYAGEWHSFATGVGVGLSLLVPARVRQFIWYALGLDTLDESKPSLALREARSEGWYAVGGIVGGIALGLCCYLLVALSALAWAGQ